MKGTDSNNSARHQARTLDCPAKRPSSGPSPDKQIIHNDAKNLILFKVDLSKHEKV